MPPRRLTFRFLSARIDNVEVWLASARETLARLERLCIETPSRLTELEENYRLVRAEVNALQRKASTRRDPL